MAKSLFISVLAAAAPLVSGHPQFISRQTDSFGDLSTCLTTAGVSIISPTDAAWTVSTTAWQARIKQTPALMAYPNDEEKLASTLACALACNKTVSPLNGGHSFVAYGFGNDGNLVVSMEAFKSMSFDATTNLLTYGAGNRIGPVAKFLWDRYGRHFPHARHGRPGLAGSAIGGGFGTTSRYLGTTLDALESVTYMLYNGTTVTATKGSDLFWAAQGAGSSFGIITSLTTNTWEPVYPTAINFTISVGPVSPEIGTAAFMAVQEYALTQAPDELALRWTLASPLYRGTGYYYGDPANFDSVMSPLMENMPAGTKLTKSEFDWWTLETLASSGLNNTDGGSSPGRISYVQSLTTTAHTPLTSEQITALYTYSTLAFNRSDLSKSGHLDLWGGVSRDIKDSDTSYAHGNNLWLIKWEATTTSSTLEWPADGIAYMKAQMRPFEDSLTGAGQKLRGYPNYRDSTLNQAEWSERLYGENFARLQRIKKEVDPFGMFTNNGQSIPLP